MYYNIPRAKAPMLVVKISNKTSVPRAWEGFLRFQTKRSETKPKNPSRKRPLNARVTSAKELGTMSKNNLLGLYEEFTLTLKISCHAIKNKIKNRSVDKVKSL